MQGKGFEQFLQKLFDSKLLENVDLVKPLKSMLITMGWDGKVFNSPPQEVTLVDFLSKMKLCRSALVDKTNLKNHITKAGLDQIVVEPQKLVPIGYLLTSIHLVPNCNNEDDIKSIAKDIADAEITLNKVVAQIESARKEVVKIVDAHDKKVKASEGAKG